MDKDGYNCIPRRSRGGYYVFAPVAASGSGYPSCGRDNLSTIVLINTKLHMAVRYPLRMNPIEIGVALVVGSAAILDFSQKMKFFK